MKVLKNSGLRKGIFLAAFGLFIASFFLMLNIGLALLIGRAIGEIYYGFFIVAGFYLVVIAILYSLRDKWLKAPISNLIIKSILN